MSIPANSVIGIVGPSGSGKSTLIDVLLDFIEPHQGILKIDDKTINDEIFAHGKMQLDLSQSIFLSEGTIAENVVFEIPEGEINVEQVLQALKLAHLDELVDSLEKESIPKLVKDIQLRWSTSTNWNCQGSIL